jgi:hypothetical protein
VKAQIHPEIAEPTRKTAKDEILTHSISATAPGVFPPERATAERSSLPDHTSVT